MKTKLKDYLNDYIIIKVKNGANCPKKYWNKKAVLDIRHNYLLEYNDNFDIRYGSIFLTNATDNDYEIIGDNIIKITKLITDSSVPVMNNPRISQWLCDNSVKAYEQKKKNLMHNLINELTALFGKQNKTLGLEFFTRLWGLKYKDLTFNVYTAKGKGTSIVNIN